MAAGENMGVSSSYEIHFDLCCFFGVCPDATIFFRFGGFVDGVYSGPFTIVELSGCDGVFRKVATK